MERSKMEGWEKAKGIVERMAFPNIVGKVIMSGEKHRVGRTRAWHDLTSYEFRLPSALGYKLLGKYNFCVQCNEIRNKYLILYDNQEKRVYIKRFIYHGKEVES